MHLKCDFSRFSYKHNRWLFIKSRSHRMKNFNRIYMRTKIKMIKDFLLMFLTRIKPYFLINDRSPVACLKINI
jgi:hypothetical protein